MASLSMKHAAYEKQHQTLELTMLNFIAKPNKY